jgi:hypothetical protein
MHAPVAVASDVATFPSVVTPFPPAPPSECAHPHLVKKETGGGGVMHLYMPRLDMQKLETPS